LARLAADIGGTFTDLVLCDDDGKVTLVKTFTTPDDQSEGLAKGFARFGRQTGSIQHFLHGTTVVLNAILTGAWPVVGLLTTRGFRDVLEIMRGDAQEPYNLKTPKSAPLVPRRLRLEVEERMAADGAVLTPISDEDVRRQVEELLRRGAEVVAVCFFNAYANPAHEQAALRIIQTAFPELPVSISTAVALEWREFERTSTVVLNAGALPVVRRYLQVLTDRLRSLSIDAPALIMQSNGGVTSVARTRMAPIRTVMSGPVGGVVAARGLGEALALRDLITLDIGGTSADVGLVQGGELVTKYQNSVRGWPILSMSVDVHSVGAGGGSIAHLDEMGAFKVGPRSAAAVPGPACFGRGGELPTVTDAHLIVGNLDPAYFLGGEVPIHPDRAARAFERHIAAPLNLAVPIAALGAIDIINTVMATAIRDHSVVRGHDPREFALVAFGGCGGLHASQLARAIGMRTVVIPPMSSAFSALGILGSDLRRDFTRTYLGSLAGDITQELDGAFGRLEAEARAELRADGVDLHNTAMSRSVDIRYVGQQFTMDVAASSPCDQRAIATAFIREHRALYGHAMEGNAMEVTGLRVTAISAVGKTAVAAKLAPAGATARAKGERRVLYRSELTERAEWLTYPVFDRVTLPEGMRLPGPAIVEETSSTTLVLPGDEARVHASGSLVMTVGR